MASARNTWLKGNRFVLGLNGIVLDDWGFESRQELGIFLFTTASRAAQGFTQPPIQWVPGVPSLSLGVKRPGREADHSPLCSAEVKECFHDLVHS
jgi:hypothetical protein